MSAIDEFNGMLLEFEQSPDQLKWDFHFPMGVFGTLREGWGNAYLMGTRQGTPSPSPLRQHVYKAHYKAFLHDFVAVGLRICYEPGSTAPFEIYEYTEVDWAKMIGNVDRLEGFSPGCRGGYHRGGYHRTLARLHVLPADFKHPQFESKGGERRNLHLPKADWIKYPSLPCWIYSSVRENDASIDSPRTPIIWDGVRFDK